MPTATEIDVPTVINGFTVIAHKIDDRGHLVVLGHRLRGAREYVVGWNVHPDGKSWGSGTYCWDLRDALDHFEEN
jgi:hypothetical protein